MDDSFDRNELGTVWTANAGSWKISDGVLCGSELTADEHSAVIRRTVETRNAVYDLKFRFVRQGKTFHLGFDPKSEESDKKGHLFSVIMTPTSWKIQKHRDKKRPDDDPDMTIASRSASFLSGQWYSLRITTWGPYVTARIEGVGTLKGSHRSFDVSKPALIFRCAGDGVEIDSLKVFTQKK